MHRAGIGVRRLCERNPTTMGRVVVRAVVDEEAAAARRIVSSGLEVEASAGMQEVRSGLAGVGEVVLCGGLAKEWPALRRCDTGDWV